MTPTYDPVAIARQYLFVRERHDMPNKGLRVEAIQRWSNGNPGDSWCCEFATMVLDIAFQGNAPIPRLQLCEDVHELAIEKHWIVPTASIGDVVLSVTPEGHAHHIGLLTSVDPLVSIAGNTSSDGSSSNGDGVYEHAISPSNTVFVHYPR